MVPPNQIASPTTVDTPAPDFSHGLWGEGRGEGVKNLDNARHVPPHPARKCAPTSPRRGEVEQTARPRVPPVAPNCVNRSNAVVGDESVWMRWEAAAPYQFEAAPPSMRSAESCGEGRAKRAAAPRAA